MAGHVETMPKILVVDDEKLIRLTMSARLKRVGYEPVAVGTVEDAVPDRQPCRRQRSYRNIRHNRRYLAATAAASAYVPYPDIFLISDHSRTDNDRFLHRPMSTSTQCRCQG